MAEPKEGTPRQPASDNEKQGAAAQPEQPKRQAATSVISVVAVLARAVAYIVRARRTRAAIERMKGRYEDRAASARYLSGAMAVLDVDAPTVTAYSEVAAKGEAAAANIGTIISAADALVVNAQELETETQARHGRMQDANRTHDVPMASRSFIKRQ